MKKTIICVACACFLICFSGCGDEDLLASPSADHISRESSVQAESISEESLREESLREENSEYSGIGDGITLPDDIF